jgi:hypothetical protein
LRYEVKNKGSLFKESNQSLSLMQPGTTNIQFNCIINNNQLYDVFFDDANPSSSKKNKIYTETTDKSILDYKLLNQNHYIILTNTKIIVL